MEFRIQGTDTNPKPCPRWPPRIRAHERCPGLGRTSTEAFGRFFFLRVLLFCFGFRHWGFGDQRLGVSALRVYLLLALTKFSASMFELSLPLCDHCQRHLLFASET